MSDMQRVAEMAAKAAVQETFLALGVDITTPEGVIRAQEDFGFLRTAHRAAVSARCVAAKYGLVSTLAALGAIIYAGLHVKGLL